MFCATCPIPITFCFQTATYETHQRNYYKESYSCTNKSKLASPRKKTIYRTLPSEWTALQQQTSWNDIQSVSLYNMQFKRQLHGETWREICHIKSWYLSMIRHRVSQRLFLRATQGAKLRWYFKWAYCTVQYVCGVWLHTIKMCQCTHLDFEKPKDVAWWRTTNLQCLPQEPKGMRWHLCEQLHQGWRQTYGVKATTVYREGKSHPKLHHVSSNSKK